MNASYAVLEVVTFSGLSVPVLDMPMKEDTERERPNIPEDILKRAEKLHMTKQQREIWRLYAAGHKRTEIARKLGKSNGTVYNTITRLTDKLEAQCPNSPCCFGCPLPECVIRDSRAMNVNVLPSDRIRRYAK